MSQAVGRFAAASAVSGLVVLTGVGTSVWEALKGPAAAGAQLPPAVFTVQPNETELLNQFVGETEPRVDGAIVLRPKQKIRTRDVYKMPFTVHVGLPAKGPSVKLTFGRATSIYDGDADPPLAAAGTRFPVFSILGRGSKVPRGQWVDWSIYLQPQSMQVWIDDDWRGGGPAGSDSAARPLTIENTGWGPVRIASVRVGK